ncbi:unnamed protein product [Victoria cruziana]
MDRAPAMGREEKGSPLQGEDSLEVTNRRRCSRRIPIDIHRISMSWPATNRRSSCAWKGEYFGDTLTTSCEKSARCLQCILENQQRDGSTIKCGENTSE